MNASKQQESILPVGTRIMFTKTLTCEATGDHPDFLYAQAGDEGEITGHGTKEGYWAKTSYNPPFGVSRDEFEPIELSKQQESERREAHLHLDGWEGRTKQPVIVIGETPKRYRITCEQTTRLAGRIRSIEPGEQALVPKYSITFPKP